MECGGRQNIYDKNTERIDRSLRIKSRYFEKEVCLETQRLTQYQTCADNGWQKL